MHERDVVRVSRDAVCVERQDLRVSYAYVRRADGSGSGRMTHRRDPVVDDVWSHDVCDGGVVPLRREVVLEVTVASRVSVLVRKLNLFEIQER